MVLLLIVMFNSVGCLALIVSGVACEYLVGLL